VSVGMSIKLNRVLGGGRVPRFLTRRFGPDFGLTLNRWDSPEYYETRRQRVVPKTSRRVVDVTRQRRAGG